MTLAAPQPIPFCRLPAVFVPKTVNLFLCIVAEHYKNTCHIRGFEFLDFLNCIKYLAIKIHVIYYLFVFV